MCQSDWGGKKAVARVGVTGEAGKAVTCVGVTGEAGKQWHVSV